MLAQRYSGESVHIQMESYPAAPLYQGLAQLLSVLKFVLIYTACSEFNPLTSLGFMTSEQPMPEWLNSLKQNKLYSCLMLFFVFGAIEGSLVSTGAFEVYANDKLIASKLQTGKVVQPQELMNKLDEIMGVAPGSQNFMNERL